MLNLICTIANMQPSSDTALAGARGLPPHTRLISIASRNEEIVSLSLYSCRPLCQEHCGGAMGARVGPPREIWQQALFINNNNNTIRTQKKSKSTQQ